jgi:hypothetical protein
MYVTKCSHLHTIYKKSDDSATITKTMLPLSVLIPIIPRTRTIQLTTDDKFVLEVGCKRGRPRFECQIQNLCSINMYAHYMQSNATISYYLWQLGLSTPEFPSFLQIIRLTGSHWQVFSFESVAQVSWNLVRFSYLSPPKCVNFIFLQTVTNNSFNK